MLFTYVKILLVLFLPSDTTTIAVSSESQSRRLRGNIRTPENSLGNLAPENSFNQNMLVPGAMPIRERAEMSVATGSTRASSSVTYDDQHDVTGNLDISANYTNTQLASTRNDVSSEPEAPETHNISNINIRSQTGAPSNCLSSGENHSVQFPQNIVVSDVEADVACPREM